MADILRSFLSDSLLDPSHVADETARWTRLADSLAAHDVEVPATGQVAHVAADVTAFGEAVRQSTSRSHTRHAAYRARTEGLLGAIGGRKPGKRDVSAISDPDINIARGRRARVRVSEATAAVRQPLRQWFLANLASPYPTPSQKQTLAHRLSIHPKRVEAQLTNWRRRSGWTDIKDQHAGGTREGMKRLIEAYERGEEERSVVREAVEKLKVYLDGSEDNKVGSWVAHVIAGTVRHQQAGIEQQPLPRVTTADSSSWSCPSATATKSPITSSPTEAPFDFDLTDLSHLLAPHAAVPALTAASAAGSPDWLALEPCSFSDGELIAALSCWSESQAGPSSAAPVAVDTDRDLLSGFDLGSWSESQAGPSSAAPVAVDTDKDFLSGFDFSDSSLPWLDL